MMKIAIPVLSTVFLALIAVACNNPTQTVTPPDEEDLGDAVLVDFGDGEVTLYLRAVTVEQIADGTVVNAEVISDMPTPYTFHGEFRQDGSFDLLLHNSLDISHTMAMSGAQLDAEFIRPSWVRSELIGFIDAAGMDGWVATHVDNGTADCTQMPLAYQDMPLQYAAGAILDYLITDHGVSMDRTRMSRIMCAQGTDEAETQNVRLDYPRGYAGWEALRDGNYLPTTVINELPLYDEPAMVTKNNCPRDIKSASVQTTYETQNLNYAPTNLDFECTGGSLAVDSQCCVDENLEPFSRGTMRKVSLATSSFCSGVLSASGAPINFAFFDMSANARICPTADNSCWGNGVRDNVTPFACRLSGYDPANSTGGLATTIGDEGYQQSGVAAWHYLKFTAMMCYEHGATTDRVYKSQVSVDTNKPSGLICRDDNIADCACTAGP